MMLSDARKEHLARTIKARRSVISEVMIKDVDDVDFEVEIGITAFDMVTGKRFVSTIKVSEELLEDSDENMVVRLLLEMMESAVERSRPE